MAGIRVDPAEVGPRISAALSSAAAALAAPAAITPPAAPGADPVSVAAAGQVAASAGRLSADLAGGIARITEGSQAVAAALQRYVDGDAAGAQGISGGSVGAGSVGGAVQAALSALNIPAPPAVSIPDMPDTSSAVAQIPAEPATVDDALRGGAGEAGMEAHAAAWDSAAAELSSAAAALQALATGLPGSWDSEAASLLSARLQSFGQWMNEGATSAGAQAMAARQVGSYWRSAVAEHPRAEDVRQRYKLLLAASTRAAAGDPRGAAEAAEHERAIEEAREVSASTINRYGEGAGGVNDQVNKPGDSPRISGDGDPRLPDKPAGEIGSIDDPAAADELQSGDAAQGLGESTGQGMQSVMSTLMQIPSMVANAGGQMMGKAGESVQQMGQQASQAASQLGNVLGGGGSPTGGSGLGSSGRNPLSALGSGGGGSGLGGGGGGAGGGGRTMPASLPEQAPAAAPPPAASSTTAPSTGAGARPGGFGGSGMMPMGMMPHNRGGEGDKEAARNKDWFPDEPLIADEPEVSEPVAGQRRRVRPTET